MITRVNSPETRASFCDAMARNDGFRVAQTTRLRLFEQLPGSGWQFYTNQPDYATATENATATPPAALSLRGTRASVAGAFDPEELSAFLQFLGIETLVCEHPDAVPGYVCKQEVSVYALAAHAQLTPPAIRDASRAFDAYFGKDGNCKADVPLSYTLDKNPPLSPIVSLLWGDDPAEETMRTQYYSDSCTARNHGVAEFWLVCAEGQPIFTVGASAIAETEVFLSAGETIEALRGYRIGGHYIASIANTFAEQGYTAYFICEPHRYHFYEGLGFQKVDTLYELKQSHKDLRQE